MPHRIKHRIKHRMRFGAPFQVIKGTWPATGQSFYYLKDEATLGPVQDPSGSFHIGNTIPEMGPLDPHWQTIPDSSRYRAQPCRT